MLDGLAHEIWATAQLLPHEGIVDGVDRIITVIRENQKDIVQQLKPAMPSFEILWSRIEQQYAALGCNFDNYHLAAVKDGARDMYKLITEGV